MKYDFSGWATKANLLCSDGRIIMPDAFKHNDGQTVPLVWNHQHDDPTEVLGHALLENRKEGVYAYCTFNDTESGKTAKLLVKHGDVNALSIYANQLKSNLSNVIHGNIREVSLVLSGANPGACIQNVVMHGEECEEEGYIFTDQEIELYHSENNQKKEVKEEVKPMPEEQKKAPEEETIADVFNTLSEKQKTVVYALIGQALDDAGLTDNDEGEKEEDPMKHNVFENDNQGKDVLMHSEEMATIIADGKRYGSLKESFLAHAGEYGIDSIDFLFPDAKAENAVPSLISRDMGWVAGVMSEVHHTPFSRIKSIHANITEDDARAKGYLKGKLKKEEVFSLLKRSTTPTTVYKKQKLDRDDVIDIVDFDVVAFLKAEMRTMLDEEIARALFVGDGRLASSDDKINESNIRPILTDAALYTIQKTVDVAKGATDEAKAKAFIKAAIKARKDYKGSGNPSLYTTEDVLTNCLLIEDTTGRIIYEDETKLAKTLRVGKIVTVPVMENVTGPAGGALMGIIVNLVDYTIGADKGGAVNMFDDFDIDYNQQKYLIETRCSGALTKPYSAIVLELNEAVS